MSQLFFKAEHPRRRGASFSSRGVYHWRGTSSSTQGTRHTLSQEPLASCLGEGRQPGGGRTASLLYVLAFLVRSLLMLTYCDL